MARFSVGEGNRPDQVARVRITDETPQGAAEKRTAKKVRRRRTKQPEERMSAIIDSRRWKDEDYDVLVDCVIVGRFFFLTTVGAAGPALDAAARRARLRGDA